MNIFVILIMGIMLATYQYFTSKRSSDVVLNKDELRLQAELSCMKQYHDFASSVNESIGTEQSLKGTSTNQASYTCTGSDELNVQKYCINAAGAKIPCSDTTNVSMHCVSTTKWKTFSKQDQYLTTQILKAGVSIINNNMIKGKYVMLGNAPTAKQNSTNTPIGLITCVSAEKINLQNRFNGQCEEGLYATYKEDGTIVCKKASEITPCTAHENEQESKTDGNCTELPSGKFCCPIDPSEVSCPVDKKPVWNTSLRFWTCSDGTEYCAGKKGYMDVHDDRGNSIPSKPMQTIDDAWTPKYDDATKSFVCYPKANLFTQSCKSLVPSSEKDYAFLNITNLSSSVKGNLVQSENAGSYTHPTCTLAYKQNSNAVENCTPCETTYFDGTRWTCKPYPDLSNLKASVIDELRGMDDTKYNRKGIRGCFSGCSDEQIQKMKTGIYNEPTWGVSYNPKTRMWNCFNCGENTYNNACDVQKTKTHECSTDNDTITVKSCSQNVQGKCFPKTCSTEYQVLIDGQCYTKWCNSSYLPENTYINSPKDTCCPSQATWMVYNEKLTCVYCIRPPAERLE